MPVSRSAFIARLLLGYVLGMLSITWLELLPLPMCIGSGVVGAALVAARRLRFAAGALLGFALSSTAAHDALGAPNRRVR